MATNFEMEMRWVDAWRDLIEMVGTRWNVECLLPDGRVVNVENCQGWLQDSAYEGYQLQVAEGWVQGKRGTVVDRFK